MRNIMTSKKEKWRPINWMKGCIFLASLALLTGLIPALIPYLSPSQTSIAHTPSRIAQFTGLSTVASSVWYLLAASVIAWLYRETWIRSFLTSFLFLVLAFATFYLFVTSRYLLFGVFNLTDFPFTPIPPTPMRSLVSALSWIFISFIACVLAASIVRAIWKTTSRWVIFTIFTLSYLCFIWLIYMERARRAINSLRLGLIEDSAFPLHHVIGNFLEVAFPLLLTTTFFYVGLRQVMRSYPK